MELFFRDSNGSSIVTLNSFSSEYDKEVGWHWIDFKVTVVSDIFSATRWISARSVDFEVFLQQLQSHYTGRNDKSTFENLEKYLVIDVKSKSIQGFPVKVSLYNNTFDASIHIKYIMDSKVCDNLINNLVEVLKHLCK